MKIQRTHWQPFSTFFQHQPRGTVSYSWHWRSGAEALQQPNRLNGGHGVTAAGEQINLTGKKISREDFFFCCLFFNPSANEEKCQCVWWLVYVLNAVYFLCVPGQWGLLHSVLRVGVLGWLRPMVLHNQPAKSTSSTSDRLMNVWFCERVEERATVCIGSSPAAPCDSSQTTEKTNNEKNKKKSSSTHHQELQVRSLRRVFDQTARATESLVMRHIASNKHTPTRN